MFTSLDKAFKIDFPDEIDTSLSGGEGKICIKINSLQDKDVINKLYEARYS